MRMQFLEKLFASAEMADKASSMPQALSRIYYLQHLQLRQLTYEMIKYLIAVNHTSFSSL